MMYSQELKIIKYVKKMGVIRPKELARLGIHRKALTRLCQKGMLFRVGRGLYEIPDTDIDLSNHNLAEASKKVPNGIICLISALAFNNIGTHIPHNVWMAISSRSRTPDFEYPSVRFIRMSSECLYSGYEEHIIDGVPVKITTPAKTIIDCFKYRNKIGIDVAKESLKDSLYDHKCTPGDLNKYAKICRMTNVIRPYIEALT